MKGKNTILAAETGSGKTLAYLIPTLTRVFRDLREPKPKFVIKKEND